MRLAESLEFDRSGFAPVERELSVKPPVIGPSRRDRMEPDFNPMMRCPLPPVSVMPDSLRQFYLDDKVPQVRLMPPPSAATGASQTTVVNNATTVVQQSGGGGTATSIVANQTAITSPFLGPSENFVGSLQMAKSFQLLGLSCNFPCRIRLYGNGGVQTLDLARALDAAPNAGTTQGMITDLVLDSSPFLWNYQNRIGGNADSPQTSLIYITVTNLDNTSREITVSLAYVPLES
jgi:hypothetical protein